MATVSPVSKHLAYERVKWHCKLGEASDYKRLYVTQDMKDLKYVRHHGKQCHRQLHNRTYPSQSQVVATNLEDNPKRTLTYNALSHIAHCLQKQPINTHYYTYKKKLRKLIKTIPQSYMLAS